IEAFDPDGQVLQSEQRSEPSGAAADAAGSTSVVSNTYQNSRRLEKIVGAVGNVTKLTVAVLVDDSTLQGGAATGLNLERLQTMGRDAVGLDATRGDRLTVLPVPFGPTALLPSTPTGAAEPPPARDWIGEAERYMRPVIGLAAIGAMLMLAFRV